MIQKLTVVALLALVAYVASEPGVFDRDDDPITIAVNTDNGGDIVKVSDAMPYTSYAPWGGYGNLGVYGPYAKYGGWGGYGPWTNYGGYYGLNKLGYYPGGPYLGSGYLDARVPYYPGLDKKDISISSVDQTDVDINVSPKRRH